MGIATGRDKNISHVNLIVKEISKLFPVLCFGKFASIIHIFLRRIEKDTSLILQLGH